MPDPESKPPAPGKPSSRLTVASRYVPVLAGAMALVLLIVVVPDATKGPSSAFRPGGPTTPVPGATSNAPVAQGGTAVPTVGGPVPSPSRSGITVTGGRCKPGVRQFSWSPYAPMCTADWSGPNGGATAHGVTASTITLVMRRPSDWDSTAQNLGQPSFASLEHDTRVLVDFFNGQYELYGRKVVVKTFNGRGSFFGESANTGQDIAESDAQTAYDLGAFADGFPLATGTYANAEAGRHIVHFAPANSEAAYKANAPYRFGFPAGAVNEVQGAGIGSLICRRMAKMNAIFAGDPAYKAAPRKFAYVEAQQPDFAGSGAVLEAIMKSCGVPVERFEYSANVNEEVLQAAQITRRLKADQVSTVVMFTDPLMSQFMTQAATNNQYRPEWLFTVFPQSLARQADASQMEHAIDISPWHATTGAPNQRLCARIYKLADPNGSPQSGAQGIDFTCSLLMAFYAGLQQAGPSLSPATFYNNWFTLPQSTSSSDFGRWSFGAKQWSPVASFSVLRWNANATSPYDNGQGQWEPCAGPIDYLYKGGNYGSGQLKC